MTSPNRPASYVYCPTSQRVDEDACRALLDQVGAALWISGAAAGVPDATLLPTRWHGRRLIAHASAHNEQFAALTEPTPCRVVVQGPAAYVSPRWYPSVAPVTEGGMPKGRALGRAVGTWNYQLVQLGGVLRVHRDLSRLREEVVELGQWHDEQRLQEGCPADAHRGPWHATELPADYLAAMLRGIVGLELEITEIVGRFKLGQNRTALDREGVAAGLSERGRPADLAVSEAMRTARPLYEPGLD